jgi:parvulin-like peptidyl-prolyl isomerase
MILRHILVKHEYEAQDIERKLDEAGAINKAKVSELESKKRAAEEKAAIDRLLDPTSQAETPHSSKSGVGSKARKAAAAAALEADSPAVEAFAELAKKFSHCSSREVGGSLGDLTGKMNRLDPVFREAAEKLEPGERTAPVRTQFGYHIIFRER